LAAALVDSLISCGILRASHLMQDGEQYYEVTEYGSRFMLASGAKPIKRATADRLLRELLERAEQINSDQSYLHVVEYIGVFGSYLSGSPTINDLDVVYSLKRRDGDSALFMKRSTEKVRRAKEGGRRFSSYCDELSWPEVEVLRALKGASTAISLHSTGDVILQRTTVRDLYRHSKR
jgi:hypothetical protein